VKTKQIYILVALLALFTTHATLADEIAPEAVGKASEAVSPHAVKFTGGLGLGYNTYNSSVVSIGQYSLIAKFGASYRNANIQRFVLSMSTFVTALPLNTSPITIGAISDKVTIRYLGVNLRVGYDTPWMTGPWRLQLNFGWYYNTTFVTKNYFGYVNANGPQFFPTIEYSMEDGSAIGGYLKFSPISSGLSFLNSSLNYEVAIGANYMFPGLLFGKYKYTVSLDFAQLSMKPDAVRAYANSTSLGLGVLF